MQPSEDERVLAALSHASIVANVVNLAGMIATELIWTMQRDRSAYVRAHALQALVYQGAVLLVSIVLTLFWAVCLGLSLLPAAIRPDLYRSSPPDSFWLALAGLSLPIGFGVVATLYGLYGAYQTYRGRSFRYPLAGRLVRGRLSGAAAPTTPPSQASAPMPAEAARAAQLSAPAAPAPESAPEPHDAPAAAAPAPPQDSTPPTPAQPAGNAASDEET